MKRTILFLRFFLLIMVASTFVFLLACSKEEKKSMEREDLFRLKYGSFEDELNLSRFYEKEENVASQIFMKDGFFYISNSEAKKVMKFTSFGDLLSLYYNPDFNENTISPEMQHLSEKKDEGEKNEKKDAMIHTVVAVQHPFNYPTFITVSDAKDLYVVDVLGGGRLEVNYEDEIALKNIVLHFNDRGEFVDYIGQEGYGGSPFPAIFKIASNAENELIVICKVREDFHLYYYNAQGALVDKCIFEASNLKKLYKNDENIFINIESAYPAHNEKKVYVKCDYYLQEIDASTKVKKGIKGEKTILYVYDRTNKDFANFEMPTYNFSETVAGERVSVKKIYEMIGVDGEGKVFLITPHKTGYSLIFFDVKSKKFYQHTLYVPPALYTSFHVGDEAILSALFATEEDVLVSWWQSKLGMQKGSSK